MGKNKNLEGDAAELNDLLTGKAPKPNLATKPVPVIVAAPAAIAEPPQTLVMPQFNAAHVRHQMEGRPTQAFSLASGLVWASHAPDDIMIGDILECPSLRTPKRPGKNLPSAPRILVSSLYTDNGQVVAVGGFLFRTTAGFKIDHATEQGFNAHILCMDQLFIVPNLSAHLSAPIYKAALEPHLWSGILARRSYVMSNNPPDATIDLTDVIGGVDKKSIVCRSVEESHNAPRLFDHAHLSA